MAQNDSTAEALRQVKARLDKATPGPWRTRCRDSQGDANPDFEDDFLGWIIEGPPDAMRGQFARGSDAQLIVHARTDIEALVEVAECALEFVTAAQERHLYPSVHRLEKALERLGQRAGSDGT